ncbi:hypothetical protein [Actinospongicola halichondriae]|uniref:hypothetical protein n=1 Tax=Actinospongicola halichondriae TaxID=3236844 RepID=UPI003D529663
MLTTTTRFIQAIDPNAGVTRARTCAQTSAVTAPAYLANANPATAANPTTAAITAIVWSEFGRKAMTKVDFHDRWPLHSTS